MAGSAPASVGSSRRSSDSRQPPARKERSIPEACRVFRRGVASAGLSAHRRHQASARVLPWPARLPWHHVVKLRPILCIPSCCRGETVTNSRANDVAQASRDSARGIEWLGEKRIKALSHRSHNNKTRSSPSMISQLYVARASEPSLGRHAIHPVLPSSAAASGATAADKQLSADSTRYRAR